MAQLNDTDSLLVNRSGKSYQIEAQNLMAELLDDDLMLVNRGGKSYRASGADIKDSLGPKGIPNKPSIISPADGAGVPIGATTGEITAVTNEVGASWSAVSTMYGTKNQCFDGSLSTSNGGIDNTKRIVVGLPVTINGSLAYWSPATAGQDTTWTFTRTDGQVTTTNLASTNKNDSAWTYVPLPSGWDMPLNLLKIEAQRSSSTERIAAIAIDGVDPSAYLVDDVITTTLEVATTDGLLGGEEGFEKGDDVIQDSGYTPTTSALTAKSDMAPFTSYEMKAYPANQCVVNPGAGTVEFTGSPSDTQTVAFGGEPTAMSIAPPFYVIEANRTDLLAPVRQTDGSVGATCLYSEDGVTFHLYYEGTFPGKADSNPRTVTPGRFKYVAFTKSPTLADWTGASGNTMSANNYFISTADNRPPLYTCTDDTDFDNLRVNDPVYQAFNGPANAGPWPSGFRDSDTSGSGGLASWDNCKQVTVTSGDSWKILDGGKYHVLAVDTEALGEYEITFRRTAGTNLIIHTTDDPSETWNTATPYWQTNVSSPFVLSSTEANRTPPSLGGGSGPAYQRYWLFYASGNADCTFTITGTAQSGPSGIVRSIEKATNQLSLSNDSFVIGAPLVGPDTTPATGIVSGVDSGNKKLKLNDSDETYSKRWIVNQGKYAKGEESPSKDAAPDAEGLTLISSAFESTPPGSIGQTAASWQVAAYNDISFSSPVAEQLNSASELTEWEVVPELEADTKYRCRVRHISSDQESEWSDDSTFQTADDNKPVVLKPGTIYKLDKDSSVLQETESAVKFINVATGSYVTGGGFAIGSDNYLYINNADTQPNVLTWVKTPTSGVIDVCATTNSVTTATGEFDKMKGYCVILADTNFAQAVPNSMIPVISPKPVKKIGVFGTYNQLFYGITQDNEIIIISASGNQSFLSSTNNIPETNWVTYVPPGLPSDEEVIDISSYAGTDYGVSGIIMLCKSGNLYKVSGDNWASNKSTTGIGEAAVATLLLTNVKSIATAGGTYGTNQGISALQNDGTVWWGTYDVAWAEIPALAGALTPVFSGYQSAGNNSFILKQDGLLYYNNHVPTDPFTQCTYPSDVTIPTTTLGTTIDKVATDNAVFILIPES